MKSVHETVNAYCILSVATTQRKVQKDRTWSGLQVHHLGTATTFGNLR